MKLDVLELTTDRKWRSALGLNKERFYKLLPFFEISYTELFKQSMQERQAENPVKNSSITSYESLLFFTLFSLKVGLTYDVLGLVTGMDASNAKRNQIMGIEVLQNALHKLNLLPKREFANVTEFNNYFADTKELIFDGLEQRIQRPSNEDEQKKHYSGKKRVIQ